MERWEYIELRFSASEYYIYFYPEDKIDATKIKQAFKDQGRFRLDKFANEIYIYFGDARRAHSNLLLSLNILGQGGWEAFSASESKRGQSIFLKRRIEK